jgi:predicted ATPase/DNA-binding SARP family transcriptional activator
MAQTAQREIQSLVAPPLAGLTLRLLGPVRVTLAGLPLSLAYEKLLALLIFLTVEAERAHRREFLADLLWPELDAAAARHNLSQALFHLRRLGGSDAEPALLLTTRETVRLNPASATWVDVMAFRTLVNQAGSTVEQLEAAIGLYEGGFGEGLTIRDSANFEDWVLQTGEQLRRQACDLLQRLSDPHTGAPDVAQACAYARHWVALDPLNEAAQRRLMRALANAGQRTAALVQFEQCRRLLEAELGVAPEPETIALYEALKLPASAAAVAPVAPLRLNLPLAPTRLFGRDDDMAALAAALADSTVRLVSITGAGGVGKTRLALQLAADTAGAFADGVCWVQLALVREPALIFAALAQAMELPPSDARPPDELVRSGLATRHVLLLLDNCEHLLPDLATLVADLLATAPRLVILATSRSALHLSHERRYQLAPLALPSSEHPPMAQLGAAAAALFVERARAVRPGLELDHEAISAICRTLDGLPLALELAATRTRLLGPRELLARLERRLPLLRGGPRDLPERQQTLAATIDWSYQLLALAQQALFRRLAVFTGGWTVAAAEAVCADLLAEDRVAAGALDGLEALLDASLIIEVAAEAGEPRCTMLETIREFAHGQLAAHGELVYAQELHARFVAGFATRASVGLNGPEQQAWLQRVDQERDNVHAALAWCNEHAVGLGLRLAADLSRYWLMRGQRRAGRDWLERLLERTSQPGQPEPTSDERAYGLLISGMLSLFLDDLALATTRLHESVELYEPLDDDLNLAWALNNLGTVALQQGHYSEAEGYYQRSLALRRTINHTAGIAASLNNLAGIASAQGDHPAARSFYEQSLALFQQVGDQAHAASVMGHMASLLLKQQDYDEARRLYEASHAIALELGIKPGLQQTLNGLAKVARLQQRFDQAKGYYQECVAEAVEIDHMAGLALSLVGLAVIAWEEAQLEQAAVLLAAATAITQHKQLTHMPSDQAEYEHYRDLARAALAPPAFKAAWAYGQTLTTEQIAALARGSSDAPAHGAVPIRRGRRVA